MKTHVRYELFEEIGRGETSIVYRGRDMNLKIPVAVKEFRDELRGDVRTYEQFCATAQFLAGLGRNDHVVLVREVDRANGWVVMDLMVESLEQVLARGKVQPQMVRSILRQCLAGLSVLHEKGRLHGSVKPSNLLVDDGGSVRLGDCAGSSAEDEMPAPRGSYKAMAPELCDPSFGPVGPAVDLYGAGFTALELLMGKEAFAAWFRKAGVDSSPQPADKGVSWLRWHGSREETVPPVGELVPGLPSDLARTIDGLLRKQVSERFGSAEEALKSLDQKPVLLFPSQAEPASTMIEPGPAPKPVESAPAWSEPVRTSGGAGAKGSPKKVVGLVLGSTLALLAGTAPLWGWYAYQHFTARPEETVVAATSSDEKADETQSKPEGAEARTEPVEPTTAEAKAPEKPEAVAAVGTLEIVTEPDDAEVRLGDEAKTAPARYEREPGRYRLHVERPGYEPVDREVEVAAGQPREIQIALAKVAASQPPAGPDLASIGPKKQPAATEPEVAKPAAAGPPEPRITNSIGMELILIPPGRFLMGSPEGEGSANEHPRREVMIARPFYIAATEVTQGQYKAVTGANPSHFAGSTGARPEADDLPVDSVSFPMALDFCDALSKREGLPPGTYRLPTEAEWEYAARGGKPVGGATVAADELRDVAWYSETSQGRPHAVAGKRPNALGLFDTAGNVWEWCSDWYAPEYYAAADNLVDPRGPSSPPDDSLKVLRGGGWLAKAPLCRPTDRYAAPPSEATNCYGFRVARTVPALGSPSERAADSAAPPGRGPNSADNE